MSSDHTPHPESSPRATEQKTTQPHVTQKTIGAFPASLREMLPTPGTSPVSLSLLVILVAMAILARVPATQNAVHTWFTFTWDQFSLLRIWTPFTALLVPGRFDGFLLQLAVVLFVTPRLERRFGSRRLLATFFGLGALALVLGTGFVAFLAHIGEPWATNAHQLLVGDPSIGLIAALASYVASAPPVWRRRGLVAIGGYVAVVAAYSGQPGDLCRALAFVLGWLVGRKLRRSSAGPSLIGHQLVSHGHENRVLGSTLLTMLALGPVVSVVSHASLGLLSPSLVLVDDDALPSSETGCSILALGRECGDWLVWGLEARHHTTAFMQLLPVIILLFAAWGLLRGRRSAVWIAAVMLMRNALGVIITFVSIPSHRAEIIDKAPMIQQVELVVQIVAVVFVNVGLAAWLVARRRSFDIRISRRGTILGWTMAGLIVVVSACVFTGAGWLVHRHLLPPPSLGKLFWTGLSLPLPPSARLSLGLAVLPTTLESRAVLTLDSLGMWLALIVLAHRLLTAGLWNVGPSEAKVRERLRIGGGSHLAFMATWPGNRLWQDPVSGAVVAYRAVGGIALTLSSPFGAPRANMLSVVTRFHQFADAHGLQAIWYSVDAEDFSEVVEALGWQSVEVAQESVVNVQEWKTVGKKWQDVRSAISRAGREGVSAKWTTWSELTVGAYAQIVELSQDWVSDHPLPEMGFTLGGLDQLRDSDVRLMVATDSEGRVEGVLSWLPTWRDGTVVGWTLDFMRRRSDAMPGLMEFLIAQSATLMKDEGIEFMSLSGAPLAGTGTTRTAGTGTGADGTSSTAANDSDSGALGDLLTFLSKTLEPVYGFQSLHRFKQKFQPDVRSWVMVFPSALDLPAIGLAVTRSYLPHMSVTQAVRAVRELA